MGWWKVDDRGTESHERPARIIGDGPADELQVQLRAMAERRGEVGRGKPTLAGLLAAVTEALRRKTSDWCSPGEDRPMRSVVARVHTPGGERIVEPHGPAEEDVVQDLSAAFETISLQYEDAFERRPRRDELLATLAFVLGYRPEDALAMPPDWSVAAVDVVE